ncbi:MAG: hypothetical protein EKK45_03415, partial [Curvibacter sp.]
MLAIAHHDKALQLALAQALDVLPSYSVALEVLCTGGNAVSVDLDGGLCRLAAELLTNSMDVHDCIEAIVVALEASTAELDRVAAAARLGEAVPTLQDPEYHFAVVEWCVALLSTAPLGSSERSELERGVSLRPKGASVAWCVAYQERFVASLVVLASVTANP